jgi:GNAT superfamily N-acetyltransferase
MEIVQFNNKYMTEMATLFAQVYSEENSELRQWDIETATKYLQINLKTSPDFSFIALEDNKCIGGLFAKVVPYYRSQLLFIDTIQVYPQFRKMGVARELLRAATTKAKDNGIKTIHLLADARIGFPRNWYEKMGFVLSGWAEYEAESDYINI